MAVSSYQRAAIAHTYEHQPTIQGCAMTTQPGAFKPTLTVVMLIKTTPEWLGFPVDRRFEAISKEKINVE